MYFWLDLLKKEKGERPKADTTLFSRPVYACFFICHTVLIRREQPMVEARDFVAKSSVSNVPLHTNYVSTL